MRHKIQSNNAASAEFGLFSRIVFALKYRKRRMEQPGYADEKRGALVSPACRMQLDGFLSWRFLSSTSSDRNQRRYCGSKRAAFGESGVAEEIVRLTLLTEYL